MQKIEKLLFISLAIFGITFLAKPVYALEGSEEVNQTDSLANNQETKEGSTVVTEEEFLAAIPSEFSVDKTAYEVAVEENNCSLDYKNCLYSDTVNALNEQLKTIFQEKGWENGFTLQIDGKDYEVTIEKYYVSILGFSQYGFAEGHDNNLIHNGSVHVSFDGASSLDKDITIQYTKTENYSEEKEAYVEDKIKNIPSDFVMTHPFGEASNYLSIEDFTSSVASFLNDSSIDVVAWNEPGFSYPFDVTVVTRPVFFFKDGNLYAVKEVTCYYISEIFIPETVLDTTEDYVAYLQQNWRNWFDETEIEITNVTVQFDEEWNFDERYNGSIYTFIVSYDNEPHKFKYVVSKEETKKVVDHVGVPADDDLVITGEELDPKEDVYQEMQDKATEKGYGDTFGSYELKVESGEIGEDGLTVTFSVGDKYNDQNAYILHKKSDGTYEEFIEKVKNGKVQITVFELSPFMISFEKQAASTKPSKGNNPLTSSMNIEAYMLVSIVSFLGILYILLKKEKEA